MDKETFWATKSPLAEYRAIVFDHPSFDGPFRLVANQFEPVTLDGHVHAPTAMSISPPEQKGGAQPKLSLNFPRQVVGREFKRQLALIQASGSRAPISVLYSVYLGVTSGAQVVWRFYVGEDGGVSFSRDSVTVRASDDNPMRRQVAPIYTPDVFTGLELI